MAREVLKVVVACKDDAEVGLATYFGDAAPVYAQLQQLPVDVLILDFTYSENLVQVIEMNGSTKSLGLGLIDGRNTKLENKNLIARQVERISRRLTVEQCYLTTSCGLEYLPRDRALLKLRHLTSIKNLVQGECR